MAARSALVTGAGGARMARIVLVTRRHARVAARSVVVKGAGAGGARLAPARSVVVTGAGRGLGRLVVERLCASGWKRVICVSSVEADLHALRLYHKNVETVNVDVSNWDALQTALEAVGDIDALVNTAAAAFHAPLLETTAASFDATMRWNVASALCSTQVAARSMIRRGVNGAIVNVSSQAALFGFRDHASFCASKAPGPRPVARPSRGRRL
ncbi:hypothetical protein M885DRAFT_535169 [Pelagophyceae sp. CCMP2097]|nr:hypothetical protein M885DRAFT_535169 [Pelagophyceae sp. CCMP2097]